MMSGGGPTTGRKSTVRALTEKEVRRSFVNCSRGEADAMTLPRTFPETPWEELVVLGWRDPRAPLRGYLVVERDGQPVGVAVRAADTRMSSATPAMCLLCQTAQSGSDVSLFTARRAGAAGRNGNTVGTYVCADLGCAVRARAEIPPWLRERDPEEVAAERTAELEQRVHGFLAAVLR
jgi:FBP C-terminal treble-clef zinc-finger